MTTKNAGIVSARDAAKAVYGWLAIPEMDGIKCDFNDLHQRAGMEAVTQAIEKALAPTNEVTSPWVPYEWPKPLPLMEKVEAEEYPLDALPDTIRAAIE